MSIDELIEALTELRDAVGGDVEVSTWEYAGGIDTLCDVHPRFDCHEYQVILDTTYQ